MGIRYQQIISGEWYPLERIWDLQCCSCSLIHEVEIRVKDGQPEIRMTVQSRATAAARAHRRKRKLHVRSSKKVSR